MITVSTPETLLTLRSEARVLINEFDAADGLAAYYMLHHDPRRTVLTVHHDAAGTIDGCLVCCQTGFDLFRPLVTLRARGNNDPVPALVEAGLAAGRPYLIVCPAALVGHMEGSLALSDVTHNRVMRLDPARFCPQINAMVVSRTDPDGGPRAEVRRGSQVMALAGINWCSPIFAEVFVRVEPEVRGQGWGRAVAAAVVAELLKRSVMPLYITAEGNDASYDLALEVGFVDTGAREIMAQGVRLPPDDTH